MIFHSERSFLFLSSPQMIFYVERSLISDFERSLIFQVLNKKEEEVNSKICCIIFQLRKNVYK
jgi:hypothetical protein